MSIRGRANKPRSAINGDLFATESKGPRIGSLGDPLGKLSQVVDFAALASEVDRVAPRVVSAKGGHPSFPAETMVRILVLKRLHNLPREQAKFQLLDRTTVGNFENRFGANGAAPLFDGLNAQPLRRGYLARDGQTIDATLVPAPTQQGIRQERVLLDAKASPAKWERAKHRQKDTGATWTKKYDENYFGQKLSVNADRRYKLIRKIEADTANVHDGQHFDTLFDRSNTSADVYADRGYLSQAPDSDLRGNDYRQQIK
jgi:IS5 family transposase